MCYHSREMLRLRFPRGQLLFFVCHWNPPAALTVPPEIAGLPPRPSDVQMPSKKQALSVKNLARGYFTKMFQRQFEEKILLGNQLPSDNAVFRERKKEAFCRGLGWVLGAWGLSKFSLDGPIEKCFFFFLLQMLSDSDGH